jgi:hypothetical protein
MDMTTELLGQIVTWDTKGGDIPIAKIRAALLTADLPDVAGDLNNRSAFSRATKHLKENRSIDKVKDTKDGKVIFQLTRKDVIDDKVSFLYETQVTLDTTNGDIICDDSFIESEARRMFAHAMEVRSASDITRMVQALFKNNADLFPINPSKGVAYFVPACHSEFTAKVSQFLSEVGGCVWQFPVPKGTPEGNKSVKEAVASGLRAILDELNGCVDEWDDTTRQSTMTRGVKKWQEIKHKAECYAEYLASEQSELLKQIEAAKLKLIDKVSAVTQTEAAA